MLRLECTDCHLHLQDERLADCRSLILARAREWGVRTFLCNGTRPPDWQDVLDLAKTEKGVRPYLGLHPWFVDEFVDEWEAPLRRLVANTSCGVGEIGLDRLFVKSGYDRQESVFEMQLELAHRLQRPVAIHCVKAWDRLEGILRSHQVENDILMVHSFGGSRKLMYRLLDLGVIISFSPNLAQASRRQLRDAFRAAPLDRIVLETDSPDLFREELLSNDDRLAGICPDRRNEPAIIVRLHERAADLRDIPVEALAARLARNAAKLLPATES